MSRFLSTITSKNVGQRRPRSDSPPDTSASAEPTTPTPSTSALVTQSTHHRPLSVALDAHHTHARTACANEHTRPAHPDSPHTAHHVSTALRLDHCRKKVADGVRSLMTDVQHLATRKPANGQPRLFEEIYQLRSLANDLERHFYPKDIIQHIKEPTTDTLPTPPAPVEAATAKPTYATAAKAATLRRFRKDHQPRKHHRSHVGPARLPLPRQLLAPRLSGSSSVLQTRR
ncbi:hypothetical protein R3P38DRAFT_3114363 [Favolaschia claudopus]|uniref:Uncharacterized protein n=1 Tax=Favolaschia claudopus TaxID=2862362 RepID=A0AAV9ZHC3_9AGAR